MLAFALRVLAPGVPDPAPRLPPIGPPLPTGATAADQVCSSTVLATGNREDPLTRLGLAPDVRRRQRPAQTTSPTRSVPRSAGLQ